MPALGPPQCNYHRVIKQGLLEKPPLGSMLRISAPITTEFPWFSHRHVLIAGDLRPAISARLDNYEAHADERNKDAFKVSLAASSGKSPWLKMDYHHLSSIHGPGPPSPADRDRFLWGKCWGKWGQHLCKPLTYWNYCCHSPFPFPHVFSKKRGDFAHCRSFIVWEIWIKNDRTIKMSDLWCHRKLSGCEKNTLRHNGSDRKARAHFPHMFPTASRESRQLPTRVGCKLFDFGLKADFISPDFAFMCEGLVLPSFPPSFPRDLPDLPDPAARWWIATRMASWWWKRSNRVLFRAPTATASSTRPSRCPPPKPSRTARICQDSRVECCWHVPTCSSHEWIEYD